jgi:competence protein ComFC
MRYIFDSIWRYIGDIFLDDTPERISLTDWCIQDLTSHYREDFPKIALDRVIVAMRYGDMADILESYKYHSDRSHVDPFVSMLSQALDQYELTDVTLMTVPMHWSRYTLRGFDHMDYLMKKLSRVTQLPYIQPLSTSFSRRQSKLSRAKRLENRKNHFTIEDSIILPKRVVLIDDVISTWATAHECAKLLKQHGVEEVIGVFLSSSAIS